MGKSRATHILALALVTTAAAQTPFSVVSVELSVVPPVPPLPQCGIEAMQHVLLSSTRIQKYSCERRNNTRWVVSMVVGGDDAATIIRYLTDMQPVLGEAMALLNLNVTQHSAPVRTDILCEWEDEFYNMSSRNCTTMTACVNAGDSVWSQRRALRTPLWDDRNCAVHTLALLLWVMTLSVSCCVCHCAFNALTLLRDNYKGLVRSD